MKRKILIVDDEEVIRKFLKIHLAKLGFEVKEASDGEQAIDALGKDDFDLLICDILMPKKTDGKSSRRSNRIQRPSIYR